MVRKYSLLGYSFQQAAAWPFGGAVFNIEYDVMSDTTKSRQFGFHEFVDTEAMLIAPSYAVSADALYPAAGLDDTRKVSLVDSSKSVSWCLKDGSLGHCRIMEE